MIDITQREASLLDEGVYQVHLNVSIEDIYGNFVDVTDLDGVNWVSSLEGDADIDNLVETCTIELNREKYNLSLSKFKEGSKYNENGALIDLEREVVIQTAITEPGIEPSSEDWIVIFWGYIDDISLNTNPMKLECSDLAGRLQRTHIKEERRYGSEVTRDEDGEITGVVTDVYMEEVIDAILRDNELEYVADLLEVEKPTEFGIYPYLQQKEKVAQAIEQLYMEIGWDFRYKYFRNENIYAPYLYEPDRSGDEPEYVFSPDMYFDISSLSTNVDSIRNDVRVYFGQPDEDGKQDYVANSDPQSINNYTRRYIEITEEASSDISSSGQATALTNYILSDLSEPKMTQEIELPFFPFVEINDLYGFQPNGVHYDEAQQGAVVSYRWRISEDEYKTWVQTRGKPLSGVNKWLYREGTPGVAPPTNDTVSDHVENLNAEELVKTVKDGSVLSNIYVTWDKPNRDQYYGAHVYLKEEGEDWERVRESVRTPYAKLPTVDNGHYEVKVVSINRAGLYSDFTSAPTVEVEVNGKIAPPSQVELDTVYWGADYIEITWKPHPDPDFDEYELRKDDNFGAENF